MLKNICCIQQNYPSKAKGKKTSAHKNEANLVPKAPPCEECSKASFREKENDRGQENLDLHKELSGRISESTDLGAVAKAKPKPVSPVWWPD